MNSKENDIYHGDQEIDILKIGLKLWDSRLFILKWMMIAFLVGLIIAFSIPREYTATVKLVPEIGENRTRGNLNSLAAMAGINLSTGSSANDAVNPILYPDIVSSSPFSADLLNVNLLTNDSENSISSLKKILKEDTSKPWWNYVLSFPMKLFYGRKNEATDLNDREIADVANRMFRPSAEDIRDIETVRRRIAADIDTKTNVITIKATLQDPVAAANLADTVADRLQKYIVDYRTSKARNELEYANKINTEAKEKYFDSQKQYATFADKNQGLASRSAAIELDRLQNEVTLAFNLYNSTAQQVQLAEAKVQTTTPVFALIEPSSVPIKPTKPRKLFIVSAFIFIGFLTCSFYILFYENMVGVIKAKKDEIKKESSKLEQL